MGRALRAPNSVGRSRSIEAATKKVEFRDPAHAMWAVETTLSHASYARRGRPKDGAAPPGALELSAPNLGFGWRPNFNCWIDCYERVQFSTQKKSKRMRDRWLLRFVFCLLPFVLVWWVLCVRVCCAPGGALRPSSASPLPAAALLSPCKVVVVVVIHTQRGHISYFLRLLITLVVLVALD